MSVMRIPVLVSLFMVVAGSVGLVLAASGGGFDLAVAGVSILGAEATIGLGVNAVSAVLLVFVAGLALITAEYSRRNLRGQARLARYAAWHVTASLALALMVTGSSLPVIALGWTVSGLAVSALVAHSGTASARRAAAYVRRHLLMSDAALWAGVAGAAVVLPNLDRAGLGTAVEGSAGLPVHLVAVLLVLAGVLRSALLPNHRWLFETAEAPSPVSALLHAGVVNAIGLLAVLAWPLLAASRPALGLLVLIGAATAAAMTVAGRFRADVKGKLAASTSAQMGYLAVCVGLGLPLAGLLHVIGHGCYKAYLFLRAGGQVSRARHSLTSPSRVPPATAIGAALIAAATALVALLAWDELPLPDVLPVAMATSAGAVAIAAVVLPGAALRSLTGAWASAAATLLVAGLLGTYLVVLGWWITAFPGFAGAAAVWSTPWLLVWFAGLGAAGAATVVILRSLSDGGLPAVRAWVGAASLRPGAVLDGSGLGIRPPAEAGPVDPATVSIAVDAARAVVGPAWPLRNAVAANPLSGLQDLNFHQAGVVAAQTWGARTLPDRVYFRRAYAAGRITDADLAAAAEHGRTRTGDHDPGLVVSALLAVDADPGLAGPLLRSAAAARLNGLPADVIERCNASARTAPAAKTCTEQWDAATHGAASLTGVADDHANTWLLDLLGAPDHGEFDPGQLWQAWRARVTAPGMDRRLGVPGFGAAAAALPEAPAAALAVLLQDVPPEHHIAYLGRLLARNPGWPAHLAWRVYVGRSDLLSDLLAIRAAYDVLLVRAAPRPAPQPELQLPLRASHRVIGATAELAAALGMGPDEVDVLDPGEVEAIARLAAMLAGPTGDDLWQSAFEQRYRNRLLDRIEARAAAGPQPVGTDAVHLAMCIDVRSERLRRHLEVQASVQTYGFAGFFGLAVRHAPSAGPTSDQCPVLLSPSSQVAERLPRLAAAQASARLMERATSTVATAPAVPFALAEAAAPVAGGLALTQTLSPRAWRAMRDSLHGSTAGLRGQLDIDTALDEAEQVEAAFGFLHSVGLRRVDGSLLIVAGHGAQVENNAYAAAYDCGACGGNAGYVNARIMADILNRPAVRTGLAERGIEVAPAVTAVAALHVTTTDELLIDEADVPPHALEAVAGFRTVAARAQAASAAERVATLPGGRTSGPLRDVRRRASDWAEATPEWGLAGNALFVAGPRWMTRGLHMHGRTFLHSYDPSVDQDRSVLRTILTAPMVVAHWINSQYYMSAVDPGRFGAGDKTTHNVVSDFAVLSGAHGDLRVGLPWQGLFDADPMAATPRISHEPMRLQVVLYAPGADVLRILQQHPDVLRLVTGEWLSVAVIEPQDASVHRLTPSLRWEAWDTDPLPAAVERNQGAMR